MENHEDNHNDENSRLGDSFKVGTISGSGNIVGKNISVGSITINNQQLTNMPSEYAKSLQDFSKAINEQFAKHNVSQEQAQPIQKSLDELAKEVEEVKPDEKIDYVKQVTIEAKTGSLIQYVLNTLPEAAETAATFTPLAPFSKLIGKGLDKLIKAIQNKDG